MLMPFAGRRGELATEEAHALQAHLEHCGDCSKLALADARWDEQLTRAINAVEVPERLAALLKTSASVESSRIWRAKAWRYTAVVASACIVVSLAIGWWATNKQSLDTQRLAEQEDLRESFVLVRTQETAEAYFRNQGLRVQLPSDFDYGFMSSLEVVEIEGHKAAQVEFQRGEHRARLVVFSRRNFRIAKNAERTAAASHCVVELSQNSDFVFLVIFYGESRRQHFQTQSNSVG
jgi:hypothetical protein